MSVPPSTTPPRPTRWTGPLFTALAVLSLGVGVVGLFVPGLPTTEFVLLAAWAAARGSPRLRGWIDSHRIFGPVLARWNDGRRILRRAKWSAGLAMALSALLVGFATRPPWLAGAVIACMATVLLWLWRQAE
jgi:uncharacterized membrane protein YbaN (DUF454 family)